MSEKLLSCPSGHTEGATKSPRSNGAYWELVCNADGCGWAVTGDTEAEAVTSWNTRAPGVNQKMLEALKGALIESEAIHEVMLLDPHNRGMKEPAIIPLIRAAIAEAEAAQ